jgi:hypothetical protein
MNDPVILKWWGIGGEREDEGKNGWRFLYNA